jgi:hypothetical protein
MLVFYRWKLSDFNSMLNALNNSSSLELGPVRDDGRRRIIL